VEIVSLISKPAQRVPFPALVLGNCMALANEGSPHQTSKIVR